MPTVTTNASAVFDEIILKRKISSDAELARRLDVYQSMISAMRAQRIPLGAAMEQRIIDNKLMSARRIKELVAS